MLRIRQVAERLGISQALVYSLVSSGKIGCYRIGLGRGAIRFREEDVEAYLQTCRVEGEGIKIDPNPTLRHIKIT